MRPGRTGGSDRRRREHSRRLGRSSRCCGRPRSTPGCSGMWSPSRSSGSASTSCRAATSSRPATSGTCRSRARRSRSWRPGMVLIIVSRNIDLSVGVAARRSSATRWRCVQTDWLPTTSASGSTSRYTWIVALVVGLVLGAAIGGVPGLHRRLRRGPVVHRHARRVPRLARRRIFRSPAGQTLAPLDTHFQLLGGGAEGLARRNGGAGSLGVLACVVIVAMLVAAAPAARTLRLPPAPDVGRGRARRGRAAARCSCAVWYAEPLLPARRGSPQRAGASRRPGPTIPLGLGDPGRDPDRRHVVMTYLATPPALRSLRVRHRRQPRGGRARAASTRAGRSCKTFVAHGRAVRGSAPRSRPPGSTRRSPTSAYSNELDVIAAAVIGGTSFAGGIGTIPGAVLGALVMQSLRSGMVLLGDRLPAAGHRRRRRAGRRRRPRHVSLARRGPAQVRDADDRRGARRRWSRCGTSASRSAASTPSTT